MNPTDLIGLTVLMERTSGRPEILIGLIDGPVNKDHPELSKENIHELPGRRGGICTRTDSIACQHGTFVAGVLSAKRDSYAPAICPSCTLLLRPIFAETTTIKDGLPSATPTELSQAILDCIKGGARILNISAAVSISSIENAPILEQTLDLAASRGVIIIVAAGNQGMLNSTVITRHPWVIPVVAYDLQGRPTRQSNVGHSIGRRGVGAPGDQITSLGAEGKPITLGGTSAAVPFVTGMAALLWSEFPKATAANIKWAITQAHTSHRNTVLPPLINAEVAYRKLKMIFGG